jgi:signal transduction histidine kinase
MTAAGYAFLGLTAIVAVLVAVLAFAVLRFFAAARDTRRLSSARSESLLLTTTLEDAISKLKSQERATAARAEASDQLRSAIVASLTSGLIVVNASGKVEIANPAAMRILGLGDGPLSNQSFDTALNEVINESLRTGQAIRRRTVIIARPQGPMHLGVTVSPLAPETGVAGVICLFTDLTSVMALEEQLRLKEALARLGELTAGLAHEFRNGLSTVHGYARLIDPASLPPTQQAYVEGLRQETQALGEVVTNFLNFAKPEPLTLVPIDTRRLVERSAEDAASARVIVQGSFGTIEGDEVLLRQAFSNLIRNSIEACEGAGVSPVVTISGTLEPGEMLIRVEDNGPGIPADAIPRLFTPFFTTKAGGTGLGLAIVQKIVVGHNGRIVASNSPGGGAAFLVSIPLSTRSLTPET